MVGIITRLQERLVKILERKEKNQSKEKDNDWSNLQPTPSKRGESKDDVK